MNYYHVAIRDCWAIRHYVCPAYNEDEVKRRFSEFELKHLEYIKLIEEKKYYVTSDDLWPGD